MSKVGCVLPVTLEDDTNEDGVDGEDWLSMLEACREIPDDTGILTCFCFRLRTAVLTYP